MSSIKNLNLNDCIEIFKKYDPELYNYYKNQAWYYGCNARGYANYLLKKYELSRKEEKPPRYCLSMTFYPENSDSVDYRMLLNRYPESSDIDDLVFQAVEIEGLDNEEKLPVDYVIDKNGDFIAHEEINITPRIVRTNIPSRFVNWEGKTPHIFAIDREKSKIEWEA